MRIKFKTSHGETFAIVGDERNGDKLIYSHNGQHAQASAEYCRRARTATITEANPLIAEMRSIGYSI